MINAHSVLQWLAAQPDGPWWALLRQAALEYALEVPDADVPVPHLKNWLAEWGRDIRRRQTSLLLLCAHRAKGLEFRHVVVLDGGWNRRDAGEDRDASRRVDYVAMTRAQETLTLLRSSRGNGLIDGLPDEPHFLRRESPVSAASKTGLHRIYQRLTPRSIDLGFAGRYAPTHPVHRAILALRPGDSLALMTSGDRLELCDAGGQVVCRLAKSYAPPTGMRCVEVRAAAVVARFRDESEAEYRDSFRCEQWEVVVPELVFDSE
jgi:ATP-dependent DNA helicase RecQ